MHCARSCFQRTIADITGDTPVPCPSSLKVTMSGYKEKLDELKTMLVRAEDFGAVYNFFFDHVASNREFIEASQRGKNDKLKEILKLIGTELLGKNCALTNLLMLKIRRDNLFHGGGFLNGCISTIIYFSDIDMGMAAINTVPGTGKMSYARISILPNNKNVTAASLAGNTGTLQ
jgi:hypothetical protein